MTRFVLDASVSLRWFLDGFVPAYAARVRQSLIAGASALVPALWHLEMANAFAVAERRKILDAAEADLFLDQIEQLLSRSIESETGLTPVRQVLSLARAYHLSSYDAVYLDAARRNELPLATLDESLRKAAVRAGVELFR